MTISPAPRDYRTLIAAASLIVGPLLMTIGDLMHPEERMAPAEQIAILVNHAPHWYTAHLLLFVGIVLFIPGFLAISALTSARKPAAGYAARILVLMGTAALASIFVGEMLVGRFVLDGADPAVATDLLESMFSGPLLRRRWPGAARVLRGHGCLRNSADESRRHDGLGGWPHPARHAPHSRARSSLPRSFSARSATSWPSAGAQRSRG